MLAEFLEANRSELVERCRAMVSRRSAPRATPGEIEQGIPLFLDQLIRTLRLERTRTVGARQMEGERSLRDLRSELEAGAVQQGHLSYLHGYSVNQVVHGYGDLCQAITQVADDRNARVSAAQFNTLNRLLDVAIADAVTEYSRTRELHITDSSERATGERLGFLAHELRNFLNTAMLAFAAIKSGSVALDGATSAVLDRSFIGLRELVDRALADVRLSAGLPPQLVEDLPMNAFIDDVQVAASLEARSHGCEFTIAPVEPDLVVRADRQMLSSAVLNLLQNAFKYTRAHTHVTLKAYGTSERVLIEVEDQCGGLPAGKEELIFESFEQADSDRSGVGLGLSIARRAVTANGGELRVRDLPGLGCIFTIDMPRHGVRASEYPVEIRA